MSDQIAISNLIYEYARLIDSGDFAGIGELFKRGKIIFKDSQQITEISGSKAIKELTVNGVLYATGVALVLTLPIISAIVWIVNEE